MPPSEPHMTPERFTDWLNGFVELGDKRPTEVQWTMIKDHLALVYTKVTPNRKRPHAPYPPAPRHNPSYCARVC